MNSDKYLVLLLIFALFVSCGGFEVRWEGDTGVVKFASDPLFSTDK